LPTDEASPFVQTLEADVPPAPISTGYVPASRKTVSSKYPPAPPPPPIASTFVLVPPAPPPPSIRTSNKPEEETTRLLSLVNDNSV
jgi:hypothetical protein